MGCVKFDVVSISLGWDWVVTEERAFALICAWLILIDEGLVQS